MTCATVLNIAGLSMNLAGVILLFFLMPHRVRTGGIHVTWTTENVDQNTSERNDGPTSSPCSAWPWSFWANLFAFGSMRSGRPNWSRPLPRPLVIPNVMTLKTLADLPELLNGACPSTSETIGFGTTSRQTLRRAAQYRVATAEVNVALVTALELERVEWRPK